MLRKEDIERQILEHCRKVQCQRFFVQKEHSQFFEVRSRNDPKNEGVGRDLDDEQVWSQAWGRASQYYNNIRADDTVRSGAIDEVNPWLRRTGWVPFLEGCNRRDILQSIREPAIEDREARMEEEEGRNEKIAATIWQAMGEVASISQTTVSRSGVMLRFEAIRTESNKISYHPLEPYQDRPRLEDKVVRGSRS